MWFHWVKPTAVIYYTYSLEHSGLETFFCMSACKDSPEQHFTAHGFLKDFSKYINVLFS